MANMMTQGQPEQTIEQATRDALTAWLSFERQEGKSEQTIAVYRRGLEVFRE